MTEQFKIWWESLSERERLLSSLSGALLLLAIVYWGAWKPLAVQYEDNSKRLTSSQQTLAWVEDKAGVLVQAGAGKQRGSAQPLTLQQIVSRSAQEYSIRFSRIQNKQQQIEVVIAEVEFDLFIRWLTKLSNDYYISVVTADLSKVDSQGHIKVNRLSLAN